MNSITPRSEGPPLSGNVRRISETAATWFAIALGFTIPISTAADNVVLVLLLISWLLAGRAVDIVRVLRSSYFARACWLFVGVLVVGLFWGPANLAAGLQYVGKYKQLLFVPILMSLFASPRHRVYAMWGFSIAMMITLFLSYAIALKILPPGKPFLGDPANAAVFKVHIAQSFFMAFAAFMWLLEAARNRDRRLRIFYAALALAAMFNVLFLVIGRTGHMAILILMVYWAFSRYRWRGLMAGAVVLLILVGIGLLSSAAFVERTKLGIDDVEQWKTGHGPRTSMGTRMDFYLNSIKLIGDHPLIGVGSGGVAASADENVSEIDVQTSINPHNQYILMAIRLGILGAAIMLYLFYCHWKQAVQLKDDRDRALAIGLLLIMAAGCLFNSLLMDHSEGWFYAWFASVLFAPAREPDIDAA